MKTLINEQNNAAKRTTHQISKILKSNSIEFSGVENLGDGRAFYVFCDSSNVFLIIAIKKAGFKVTEIAPKANNPFMVIKAF